MAQQYKINYSGSEFDNLLTKTNLISEQYAIPATGESQIIETFEGNYTITSEANYQYKKIKGASASGMPKAERIASSKTIKWTGANFNNTSFILKIDDTEYEISFGENEFDFSDKNNYPNWEATIQERINETIGANILDVSFVSAGSHPVTGGYGIRIWYDESLVDYPFVQVFSAPENDMLAMANISSGSRLGINMEMTIAEYLSSQAATLNYTINNISQAVSTALTLQEFFNHINTNYENVMIEYAARQDAVIIISYTGELEITDSLGAFSSLGFDAGKEITEGVERVVSLTKPDGTIIKNIKLQNNNFELNGQMALFNILYNVIDNKIQNAIREELEGQY